MALDGLLTRSTRVVPVDASTVYRQMTVRMHHKGVVLRKVVSGVEIGSPRQFEARRGQLVVSRIDARNGAIGIVPADLDGSIVRS